jgi:hypothetical protein
MFGRFAARDTISCVTTAGDRVRKATLHVRRSRGQVLGAARRTHVFLDGEQVGSLRPGKSIDVPVAIGSHEVRVTIRKWTRSLEFDATDGRSVFVLVDIDSGPLITFAVFPLRGMRKVMEYYRDNQGGLQYEKPGPTTGDQGGGRPGCLAVPHQVAVALGLAEQDRPHAVVVGDDLPAAPVLVE